MRSVKETWRRSKHAPRPRGSSRNLALGRKSLQNLLQGSKYLKIAGSVYQIFNTSESVWKFLRIQNSDRNLPFLCHWCVGDTNSDAENGDTEKKQAFRGKNRSLEAQNRKQTAGQVFTKEILSAARHCVRCKYTKYTKCLQMLCF